MRGAIDICATIIAISCVFAACSGGEKQIAASSTDIVGLAHSSRARFEIIYRAAGAPEIDTQVITSEALAGQQEQREIIHAVNTIITALPDVVDEQSQWLAVLKWGVALAIIVGLIVLLLQTGAGAWLRGVFSWMKRKREA